jgi:hypothetical protein
MVTSSPVKPPNWNPNVTVRRVIKDADWQSMVEVMMHAEPPENQSQALREFFLWLLNWMRREGEKGHGDCYLASLNGQDLASLCLFHDGQIGRYQEVITATTARGKGLCTTLVYESACDAIQRYNLSELYIVPDVGATASRIYRAIGFNCVGQIRGLFKSLKKKN